jgi:hypothetical protein
VSSRCGRADLDAQGRAYPDSGCARFQSSSGAGLIRSAGGN